MKKTLIAALAASQSQQLLASLDSLALMDPAIKDLARSADRQPGQRGYGLLG